MTQITTAWVLYPGDDGPSLLDAYDEVAYDSFGGIPDWYAAKVADAKTECADVRELIVTIPQSAVDDLFATPTVAAIAVEAANQSDGEDMR